ncbi:MAG: hypothetical protein WC755_05935 [Candidatus Woesearchaeota archaeon]|jgi:hypothetical protein
MKQTDNFDDIKKDSENSLKKVWDNDEDEKWNKLVKFKVKDRKKK